jgi:hypothetical protein
VTDLANPVAQVAAMAAGGLCAVVLALAVLGWILGGDR